MALPEGFNLLSPWRNISDSPQETQRLSAELSSELPPNHILFGLKVTAIAKRIDRDDVLFEIVGGTAPLAIVHLTWQRESDPRWPSTKLFSSWDEWVRKEMLPAHTEYNPS